LPGYRSCTVVADGCCSFNVGADGALARVPHVRGDRAIGADGCSSITGAPVAAVVPRATAAVSVNVGVDDCARSMPIAGLL